MTLPPLKQHTVQLETKFGFTSNPNSTKNKVSDSKRFIGNMLKPQLSNPNLLNSLPSMKPKKDFSKTLEKHKKNNMMYQSSEYIILGKKAG